MIIDHELKIDCRYGTDVRDHLVYLTNFTDEETEAHCDGLICNS